MPDEQTRKRMARLGAHFPSSPTLEPRRYRMRPNKRRKINPENRRRLLDSSVITQGNNHNHWRYK